MNLCPVCGLDMDLVGRLHRCASAVINTSKPAVINKPTALSKTERLAIMREVLRKRERQKHD